MNETAARPFHAEFQTFDDPPEAAAAAPRVAALREELARRGLDGFVVPHADRFQNEYLPPSEERLAWLTGFTGSAGAAVDPRRQGGAVRRRPLHHPGARPGRRQAVRHRASRRQAAERMDRGEPARRTEARLRPLAAFERGRGPPRQGLRRRRRHAGRDRRPIRSTRSGTTARRRPTARWCRTTSNMPAKPRPTSSRASAPRSRSSRPTRSSSPIRTRSPGPSTSAAPTSPTRRCRSPSRSSRPRVGAALHRGRHA